MFLPRRMLLASVKICGSLVPCQTNRTCLLRRSFQSFPPPVMTYPSSMTPAQDLLREVEEANDEIAQTFGASKSATVKGVTHVTGQPDFPTSKSSASAAHPEEDLNDIFQAVFEQQLREASSSPPSAAGAVANMNELLLSRGPQDPSYLHFSHNQQQAPQLQQQQLPQAQIPQPQHHHHYYSADRSGRGGRSAAEMVALALQRGHYENSLLDLFHQLRVPLSYLPIMEKEGISVSTDLLYLSARDVFLLLPQAGPRSRIEHWIAMQLEANENRQDR